MEHKSYEINDYFKDGNENTEPLIYWGTVFNKRKSLNKILRNQKPIQVRLTCYNSEFSYTKFKVHDIANNPINYNSNSYGSELHFFDTEEEARECYNKLIDDSIEIIDKDMIKLEQEKLKLQTLKIG